MTKIIVENGDWNGARAKLKTTLEAQNAAFNANLKATFGPKSANGEAADKQSQMAPAAKTETFLSRSKRRS